MELLLTTIVKDTLNFNINHVNLQESVVIFLQSSQFVHI